MREPVRQDLQLLHRERLRAIGRDFAVRHKAAVSFKKRSGHCRSADITKFKLYGRKGGVWRH